MGSDRMEEYNGMKDSQGGGKRNAEKVTAYLAQARLQLDRSNFEGARRYAKQALEISPGNHEAQELLARADRAEEESPSKEQVKKQEQLKKEEETKRKIEEEAKKKAEEKERKKTAEEVKMKEKSHKEAEEARKRAQENAKKEPELSGGGKEKIEEGARAAQKIIQEKLKGVLALIASYKGKLSLKEIDIRKIDIKKIDMKKLKKNYIWIILGVLIITFALSHTIGKLKQVFFKDKEKDQETTQFVETIPVKVYKVKRMDFKDTLPVLGRIEGFKEIELRFAESGVLESFNFEEGERILEGDIIASLDQKDALLKLKYASLEMEKAQKLLEIGGVDKMAADQKKLEYESAKRDLEKTNIYASSDGYLGSKETHAGSFVTPQDKIGVFVDFSEVYASFDVIEEDSPKIELGQNAEIFLDAYPGSSYTGTVDMIAPMIEGRTRTQKVKIELSNEEDELRPGMFARSVINTYEKKDALIIPASSFKKVENKYLVYVVHPEEEETEELAEEDGVAEEGEELAGSEAGIVEEREIKIEYLTHDVAEIGGGLQEGELVIRELHQEYKDKDRVEITEIQETIF